MLQRTTTNFSTSLQSKINTLKNKMPKVTLGSLQFDSPLLLAPMSAICNAPFRLLMEDLGAGGTVSELISCHGIAHKNERTKNMLRIDPREKNIGLQLFGENGSVMAEAAKVAEDYGPKFIDINMGCPVKKVVTKGGGSALLKDPSKLGVFLKEIKKAISIPLTIKIRTGWDEESINADEVIKIAKEEGVEFVSVHGRTRTQAYRGNANWDLLEDLAKDSPLPIIGNGDLHSTILTKRRMEKTNCRALMLGRGPLRNPFIFLESVVGESECHLHFTPQDYLEVIERLLHYEADYAWSDKILLVQMRKLIVWMAAGFPGTSHFRAKLFKLNNVNEVLKCTQTFFNGIGDIKKDIDFEKSFMNGGHG